MYFCTGRLRHCDRLLAQITCWSVIDTSSNARDFAPPAGCYNGGVAEPQEPLEYRNPGNSDMPEKSGWFRIVILTLFWMMVALLVYGVIATWGWR
jgi:hypothetical protein